MNTIEGWVGNTNSSAIFPGTVEYDHGGPDAAIVPCFSLGKIISARLPNVLRFYLKGV